MKPARYTRRRDTRAASPEIGRAAVAPPGSIPPGGGLSKPKKKRKSPEADFQIQAVAYLRLVLPPPCLVYFVPNGGNLSDAQARKFQRMGLLAGVHDIHIVVPGLDGGIVGCAALYTIECKAGRGKPTEEQEAFGRSLIACGGHWWEARRLEEVGAAVQTIAMAHGLTLRPVVITPSGVLWHHRP